METIGDRIKILRKELNYTMQQFGERIKTSKAHISKLEKNEDNPSDRIISLICFEYSINEDWLRNGIGRMFNEQDIGNKTDIKFELIEGIESLNLRIKEFAKLMKNGPDEEITQISYCLSAVLDVLQNKDLDGTLRFDYFDALEDLVSDLGRYVQNLSYVTGISYEKSIDEKAKEIDSIISKYSKPFNRAYEEIGEVYLQKYMQGYESIRGEHSATSEGALWDTPVATHAQSAVSEFSTGVDIPYNDRIVHYHNTYEALRQQSGRTARSQMIIVASGTGKTEALPFTLLADILKKRDENKYNNRVAEEASAYVPILGKVAAGPPIDLIEDNSGLSPVFGVKDVDFTLQISGDSMEPEYPDGSYVFVKKQETLENGEVGIIMINDQVACKKFYRTNSHVELRSFNKKYEPIVLMGGEVRVLGKVIKE